MPKSRPPFGSPRSVVAFTVRLNERDVADLQSLGQLVERDHGWIPTPALEVAQILLTKARTRFDVLLSQTFLPTQPSEIPTDQFAHVHASIGRRSHTFSVSTIVCNYENEQKPERLLPSVVDQFWRPAFGVIARGLELCAVHCE